MEKKSKNWKHIEDKWAKYILFILIGIIILLIIFLNTGNNTKTKIVECDNLVFACNLDNCYKQCLQYASQQGGNYIDSTVVNGGAGCQCEYS